MTTRVFSLLTALVLVCALTACGGQGDGSGAVPEITSGSILLPASQMPSEPDAASDDQPQAPSREPIGNPAVISYPETIDDRLISSPVYQQALTQPAVIVYQGEVLTDPQPVRDFVAAVKQGEDRDLYLYYFWYGESWEEPYKCSCVHLVTQSGSVTEWWSEVTRWESLVETKSYFVTSLELNDYGFLIYKSSLSSEPFGRLVVNDRDLYDNAEECHRLCDTYLTPLSDAALTSRTWASVEELRGQVDLVWLFEDLYYYENENNPWEQFGSHWPVDNIVETLSRYFEDITPDLVISSKKYADAYDPQTNTIFYKGGGGGMSPSFRVTDWAQEGGLLRIDYETCDYYTNAPVEGSLYTLTVKLMEDGSFRYLTNLPQE